MKTHILRAPETDRKKVLVPNSLTDFDDYNDSPVADIYDDTASISAADADAILPAGTSPVPMLSERMLRGGCTASGGTITVAEAGLYIISAVFTWVAWTGMAGHQSPLPANRTVALYAGALTFTLTAGGGNTDSTSVIVRLAGADTVYLAAAFTSGVGFDSGNWTGSLTLAKIAP